MNYSVPIGKPVWGIRELLFVCKDYDWNYFIFYWLTVLNLMSVYPWLLFLMHIIIILGMCYYDFIFKYYLIF